MAFIGHHLVEHLLKNTDHEVLIVDAMTYASHGYDRLRDIECFRDDRVTIVGWDITMACPPGAYQELREADYLLHLAAETHVDRSITDPIPFVKANVLGTMNVLTVAKYMDNLKLMVNFSTDEVFGPAPDGKRYREWDAFAPKNPYAATKAAAVHLCEAEHNTHKIPVFTTFTMNAFGERQDPEKFIPKCIIAARDSGDLPIHSDRTCQVSGSRHWIHCRNIASALLFLLDKAAPGQRFNIVGERRTNLEIAQFVAGIVGSNPRIRMVDFHSSRPGHDLHYALDGSKMAEMGWKAPVGLDDSLAKTVRWTLDHPKWLERA